MTTKSLDDLDFLHGEPVSLRAISQEWVNRRAVELNPEDPDFHGAVQEALERLVVRMNNNLKDGGQATIYCPDALSSDPYVVVIPVDQRPDHEKQKDYPPREPVPTDNKFTDQSSLRDDFVALLYDTIPDMSARRLERKENGDYYDKHILGMWKGFTLYHRGCSVAKRTELPSNYNKTLGRYVVGKVNPNGSAFFTRSPFRHTTKLKALEEATRLNQEFNAPFAIFRCLDIVDLKLENSPVSLTEESKED